LQIVDDKKDISPSPSIHSLPKTAKRRLIDIGMLHYEASIAGRAERYGRGETSHTIHVWWARRPHTAMRALVFASLCKSTKKDANKIMSQIGMSTSVSDKIIDGARLMLSSQYDSQPVVLDMFGGGGTIPFEALNLGAATHAIDANELSVFIQKCNLFYSQEIDSNKNIQVLIEKSGTKVLNQLSMETRPLYPLRNNIALDGSRPVFAYLWTYSITCEECGYRYYILKRPWLSKKNGKSVAFVVSEEENGQTISFQDVEKDYKFPSNWQGRNGKLQCPKCKYVTKKVDISRCDDETVAMIRHASGRGKEFIPLDPQAVPSNDIIEEIEERTLNELDAARPESKLPVWSGIVNPAIYGIKTHADFLNPRQRAVLVLLIKALKDEYDNIRSNESEATAKYVIGILSSLIDQIVDWNCRLSMWIPQNEQVGRGFCGPGISMLWDYVETDPVSSGPSNLWDKLNRIIKGSESIKRLASSGNIIHAYAQELPYENDFFDAIVTDPPYYDNIYYSVLADFFYAWKRILLEQIEPELFEKASTGFDRELVASKFRNGTAENAHEKYCQELKLAIGEAARVLKPDGIFSFIYSHSSLNGWEALVRAYRPAEIIITSVQPLSIERKQRPRAMTSEAVNTCITFVARKKTTKKKKVQLQDLVDSLTEICEGSFVTGLEESGWSESDTAIAVFAHGVAMVANAKEVTECSGNLEALVALEEVVKKRIPSFKIAKRRSL